jgi:uncharacterized protein
MMGTEMEKLFDLMNPLQEKRLEEMVKAIVNQFKPLQILCFASNLKTDVMLSCFSEPTLVEQCDYDILTISGEAGDSENDIQKFVSNFYRNGSVTIFNLNTDDMERAIASRNIYITTILEKGTILYISEGFEPIG